MFLKYLNSFYTFVKFFSIVVGISHHDNCTLGKVSDVESGQRTGSTSDALEKKQCGFPS